MRHSQDPPEHARAEHARGSRVHRIKIQVRFGDTDALGHVNNAVYLSYFEAARAGYYAAVAGHGFGQAPEGGEPWIFLVAEARVTYRAPIRFGDPVVVECRVAWASRSSFALEYRVVAGDAIAAEGETIQVMVAAASGRPTRVPEDLLRRIADFEGGPIPARP